LAGCWRGGIRTDLERHKSIGRENMRSMGELLPENKKYVRKWFSISSKSIKK